MGVLGGSIVVWLVWGNICREETVEWLDDEKIKNGEIVDERGNHKFFLKNRLGYLLLVMAIQELNGGGIHNGLKR